MGGNMRAADAAVRVLQQAGVRYAFSVPGESFLGLLDALGDCPDIQVISARHEGGAAFMAEAVGKLTGVPAICMGTRGVGSSNLAIGIHTAYQDSSPLIAMLGQVETPFRHKEAFQEVELGPFLQHITKWSVEVPSSERLPDLVCGAAEPGDRARWPWRSGATSWTAPRRTTCPRPERHRSRQHPGRRWPRPWNCCARPRARSLSPGVACCTPVRPVTWLRSRSELASP